MCDRGARGGTFPSATPVADDRSVATRIDQALEVSLEVRPVDLAAAVEGVVSRVTIRDDGTGECLAEQRDRHHLRPREFDREERERRGHHRPNPSLRGPLFERRFVAVNHERGRQRGLDFVVTRLQRDGRPLLLLDHPRRTANRAPAPCDSSVGGTAPSGSL